MCSVHFAELAWVGKVNSTDNSAERNKSELFKWRENLSLKEKAIVAVTCELPGTSRSKDELKKARCTNTYTQDHNWYWYIRNNFPSTDCKRGSNESMFSVA